MRTFHAISHKKYLHKMYIKIPETYKDHSEKKKKGKKKKEKKRKKRVESPCNTLKEKGKNDIFPS